MKQQQHQNLQIGTSRLIEPSPDSSVAALLRNAAPLNSLDGSVDNIM